MSRFAGWAGLWLWAMSLVGVADEATAHPFDATYYSSRAALKLDSQGLHVLVVVEVPTAKILQEFLDLYGDPTQLDDEADAIFRSRQFDRLIADLDLRINRRPAPGHWRPVNSEANGRGTETFFAYLLEFVHDDPQTWIQAESIDVRLEMEVFPRDFIYLSAAGEAEPPWRITFDSSAPLLEMEDDELIDPETGRWTVDPRLRRLRMKFDRRAPGLSKSESAAPSPTNDVENP